MTPRGGQPAPRRWGGALLVAAAVTLVAGLILGLQILSLPGHAGQFSKYPRAALELTHGTLDPDRLTDYSPLYLALHGLVFPRAPDPVIAILAIQTLFLALAAGFLFLLLHNRFGLRPALAGAIGCILLRSVPVYGYVFEPEALILSALVATAWLVGGGGLITAAGGGTALAVAFCCRPSYLPLALLIPVAMLVAGGAGRRTFARAGLFLLPVAAGLLFLAAGGLTAGRYPVSLTMNPGTVFFDGNNPLASGRGVAYPEMVADLAFEQPGVGDYQHVAYRMLARRAESPELSVGGVNRFWAQRARAFLADHPGHAARLLGRKILFLLHGYRWHDLRVAEAADRRLSGLRIPAIPFAPVAALALAGLILGAGRWRDHLVPGVILITQAAVMMVTYSSDRQRVAIIPFFVYFALVGLLRIGRGGKRSAAIALAVILLTAGFTFRTDLMKDNARTWGNLAGTREHLSRVDGALERGEMAEAGEAIAVAAAFSPWAIDWIRPPRIPLGDGSLVEAALARFGSVRGDDPSSRFDRALLEIEAGRFGPAKTTLSALDRDALTFERIQGRVPEPAYHLGRIAALTGDRAGAKLLMARALARSPGDPDILAALESLGDTAAGGALARYTDPADRWFALGQAHLRLGTPEGGVVPLQRLVALVPETRRARFYLASALGAAGRDDEAARLVVAALETSPFPILLEQQIVPLLLRWSAARPGDCETLRRAGAALRLYGRFDDTISLFAEGARLGCPGAAEGIEATRKLAGAVSPDSRGTAQRWLPNR